MEPNVVTHNAAMTACANDGQWETALQLLEEMKRSGVEPNVRSYNAAMSA